MPLDPKVVSYWIADRVRTLKSTASLRIWISMLKWLSELCGSNPSFQDDPFYQTLIAHIRKQYSTQSDDRLPFKLSDIHYFCAERSRGSIEFLSMDRILELLIIQLYFFTMSRPSELLFPNNICKKNEKKGLIFDDLTWDLEEVTIRVRDFKNAEHRNFNKFIPIQSTKCTNRHCKCQILNPYRLLQLYIERRGQLWYSIQQRKRRILERGEHNMSTKEYQIWKNQLKNLGLSKEDKLFVDSKGRIIRVHHLTKIVQQMKKALKYTGNYTSYSFRIGGSSHAANVEINQVKIMRYVGWSTSQLPMAAMRYIRFSKDELKLVPFEMVHKPLRCDPNILFDPWHRERPNKNKKK